MYKIYIVVNVDWFFLSHRLPVALEAKNRGYDVTIVTSDTGSKSVIEKYGFKVVEVKFDRSGTNPLKEFATVVALWNLYRKDKPDLIHHVSLKPCIYGSLAARFSGMRRVVNAISGLGYNFTGQKKNHFQGFLLIFLKFSIRRTNTHFIFQNRDDMLLISRELNLDLKKSTLIKGCGVDLDWFSYTGEPDRKMIRFVFPARLLYDKGIIEFIHAAESIKPYAFGKAEFILVGNLDPYNPSGITEIALNNLLINDYIIWAGYSTDMKSVLEDCHVVVLPSYREGLPKSLIEAAAVGRPIITTDAPGCRECVKDGINGFLVPVKDHEVLAEKMMILLKDKDLRVKMGKKSHEIAEKEFALSLSVNATMDVYQKMLAQ